MRRILLASLAVLLLAAPGWADGPDKKGGAEKPAPQYVLIKTSMGDITAELWPEVAPQTVQVFCGLANGKGTFTDVRNPKKKVTISKPFYDGLVAHRVIKGFMIQLGCPNGNGTGDAGFEFKDEINANALGLDKQMAVVNGKPHPWMGIRSMQEWQQRVIQPLIRKMGIKTQDELKKRQKEAEAKLNKLTLKEAYENMGYKYDSSLPSKKPLKYVLALANKGPNTNSSQFFINLADTPWLTGKHTVFGRVTNGQDVVEKIGAVKVNGSKPATPITITSIRTIPAPK